jgi:DNA-binding FadR family transcriptional regulator
LPSRHATTEHIDNLESALARQLDPNISDEAFCQADVAFHRALVDATDNGIQTSMDELLDYLLETFELASASRR